jgi:nitrous oxide reductase accessory protein NosL
MKKLIAVILVVTAVVSACEQTQTQPEPISQEVAADGDTMHIGGGRPR